MLLTQVLDPFRACTAAHLDGPVAIIGSGGHCRTVLWTLQECGRECVGVWTNLEAHVGTDILGIPVRGLLNEVPTDVPLHVALGHVALKQSIVAQMEARSRNVVWATIVHPKTTCHSSLVLGEGSFLGSGVAVEGDARIGAHTVVCSDSAIGHNAVVGSYALLGARVVLAGAAVVCDEAEIGVSAAVAPKVIVGRAAKLGALSSAMTHVPDGCSAVGVPALVVSKKAK